MKKLTARHTISMDTAAWVFFTIAPMMVWAFALNMMNARLLAVVPTVLVAGTLIQPCHDRYYGQGRPGHYVRQTVFVCATLLTAEFGFYR